MIERYSREEIKKIWEEKNKYQIWLNIEIAAAQAMEKLKIIPKGVSSKTRRKAKINVSKIHKIENLTKKIGKLLKKEISIKKIKSNKFDYYVPSINKAKNKLNLKIETENKEIGFIDFKNNNDLIYVIKNLKGKIKLEINDFIDNCL